MTTKIFSVALEATSFRLHTNKFDKTNSWCCINYGSGFFIEFIEALSKKTHDVFQINGENDIEDRLNETFPTLSSPLHFVICLPDQSENNPPILAFDNLSIVKKIFHLASFLQKKCGFGESVQGSFFILGKNLDTVLMGLAGLIKIINREWNQVDCRFVHFDQKDVSLILQELSYQNLNSAIYYKNNYPCTHSVRNVDEDVLKPDIHAKDVFLVTAGARGITAQCCLKLAKETQCSFIILGRTSLNLEKFESVRNIENAHDLMLSIKNVLMQDQEKVTPKEVQIIYKHIQAVRDIEKTLKQFEALGSRVKYYVCDITDKNQLNKVINDYAESYGKIMGIIHGAGNLNDKLIRDETSLELNDVILPKIQGLYNLMNLEIFSQIKWCILFSSVSSLFGNKGQSAYATANEILNQVAMKMSRLYPHCKTLALCWGGWELGMVNESLKAVFAKRGISLLSIEEGTQLFWKSLTINVACVILDKDENMKQRFKEHNKQTCLLDRSALEDISLNANIEKYFGADYVPMLKFDQRLRLPAPPFLFVSRIINLSVEKKPKCVGEMWFEYDIPENTSFQNHGEVHELVLAESCHAVAILAYVLLKEELLLSPSALRGSNGSIEFYGDNPKAGQTIQVYVCVESLLTIPAGKLLKQTFVGSCDDHVILKIESYAAIINPNKIHATVLPTPYASLKDKNQEAFTELNLQAFYAAWGICHESNIFLHRAKIYSRANENKTDIVVGEFDLSKEHWVFSSHFLEDPLFPASLMHFALFQLLLFYAHTKKICGPTQKAQYARNLKTKRKLIHSLYPCHETVFFQLEINAENEHQITAKAYVYLKDILLAEYEDIGVEWKD